MSWRKKKLFSDSRSNEAWVPTHTSTIPSALSHFPYTPHALYPQIPSPPKLPFPWAEQDRAFVWSVAELKLCSSAGWMLPSECQRMPESALHLPHWHTEEMALAAPPAPKKFCYNHSVLLRPLQDWFKSATEVPEKHN